MASSRSSLHGPADQPGRDANPAAAYYPDATWQHRTPSESGVNPDLLKQAIDFAVAGETKAPRDLVMNHYQTFGREPFGYAIGPIRERGDPTGIIIHKGYIVAEWGDPLRVDMTHSVTKSFLSSVVGIAVDRGMIRSVDDTVRDYVAPIQLYDPALDRQQIGSARHARSAVAVRNAAQPHDHLGQSAAPDQRLGRHAVGQARLGRPARRQIRRNGTTRPRNKPGTVYKYNDTRVNVLALAALNVWRRPLPQVLKENIMDPIGASNTWRWFGYENSWVVLDGSPVQSVTGGGHWGGGMYINAYDMARFGYLTLRHGKWNDRQLLSKQWIDRALHADQAGADLRLHELVPQHRPEALAERSGHRICPCRQRHQHGLCRSGARSRGRGPLDRS